MINVAYLCIILHIFHFSFFFCKTIYSKYLNRLKLHHLYMYLYLCVWINLYNNNNNNWKFQIGQTIQKNKINFKRSTMISLRLNKPWKLLIFVWKWKDRLEFNVPGHIFVTDLILEGIIETLVYTIFVLMFIVECWWRGGNYIYSFI